MLTATRVHISITELAHPSNTDDGAHPFTLTTNGGSERHESVGDCLVAIANHYGYNLAELAERQ